MKYLFIAMLSLALAVVGRSESEATHTLLCSGQTIPCHWPHTDTAFIDIGDNLPPEYDLAFDHIIPLWNAGQDEYELRVVPGISAYGDDVIPSSYVCGAQTNNAISAANHRRIEICRKFLTGGVQGTTQFASQPGGHMHRAHIHIHSNINPPNPNIKTDSFMQTLCHELGHGLGLAHTPTTPCGDINGTSGTWTPDPHDFEQIISNAHGRETVAACEGQRYTNFAAQIFFSFCVPSTTNLDTDGDDWSNEHEWKLGQFTTALAKCGQGSLGWPPDLNGDGFVDISDVTEISISFGDSVGPPDNGPARKDIAPINAPDRFIDITDMTAVTTRFGQSCV